MVAWPRIWKNKKSVAVRPMCVPCGVSRRHFRLSHAGDQFYIEDLSSVNGTVVNGQRISEATVLMPGDRMNVDDYGNLTIRVAGAVARARR